MALGGRKQEKVNAQDVEVVVLVSLPNRRVVVSPALPLDLLALQPLIQFAHQLQILVLVVPLHAVILLLSTKLVVLNLN